MTYELGLWSVEVPADEAELERLARALTPDERRSAEGLREGARARFVSGRSALRRLLGEHLACPPEEVPLAVGAEGKPILEPRAGETLHFNVAHSGALALIATAGFDVGVDMEAPRRIRDPVGLAARFFTPAEREHVERAPADRRERRFLELWTAKEAVLKATGRGLAGLEEVELMFGPGGAPSWAIASGEPWEVRGFEAAPGHVAAVAARELPSTLGPPRTLAGLQSGLARRQP